MKLVDMYFCISFVKRERKHVIGTSLYRIFICKLLPELLSILPITPLSESPCRN